MCVWGGGDESSGELEAVLSLWKAFRTIINKRNEICVSFRKKFISVVLNSQHCILVSEENGFKDN